MLRTLSFIKLRFPLHWYKKKLMSLVGKIFMYYTPGVLDKFLNFVALLSVVLIYFIMLQLRACLSVTADSCIFTVDVFLLSGKKSGMNVVQVFPEDGNMGRVLPKYLTEWTTNKVRQG